MFGSATGFEPVTDDTDEFSVFRLAASLIAAVAALSLRRIFGQTSHPMSQPCSVVSQDVLSRRHLRLLRSLRFNIFSDIKRTASQ
jgi:hypothetical protein